MLSFYLNLFTLQLIATSQMFLLTNVLPFIFFIVAYFPNNNPNNAQQYSPTHSASNYNTNRNIIDWLNYLCIIPITINIIHNIKRRV